MRLYERESQDVLSTQVFLQAVRPAPLIQARTSAAPTTVRLGLISNQAIGPQDHASALEVADGQNLHDFGETALLRMLAALVPLTADETADGRSNFAHPSWRTLPSHPRLKHHFNIAFKPRGTSSASHVALSWTKV
ncbi:hypothetical protein QIH77_02210 [Bradyrhizobium diazoefficiens]|uniref:hypothetical protein n=1 Tax=Bradyrhizobium diazoefficiens TaxID=1355477 RepID=UPI00272D102D|nr:hypothetical protein [Bradyrhizobium diazoefficiens]WLA74073.1 hypothetical protein QIH77_02210 [Bradyrhizobium diazoefficiens]